MLKWDKEEKTELLLTRVPLFFMLLQEHNKSEEDSIFNYWKCMGTDVRGDALKEVEAIINGYGRSSYLKMTEISGSFFRYIFQNSFNALPKPEK